jgi:periplasmic protein TonB
MGAVAVPRRTDADGDRLAAALLASVMLHALGLLGISFLPQGHPHARNPIPTLDIELVSRPQESKPEQFEYLARENQEGAGTSEGVEPPRVPAVESASRGAPPTEQVRATKVPRAKSRTVATARAPQRPTSAAESEAESTSEEQMQSTPQPISARELIARSLDLARLSESVRESIAAYNRLPRERFISARTRQSAYASYMEAWRTKVERIGNLNYPEEARRQGLTGELVLDVALNPDGTVHSVTLLRSSGLPVLDEAAQRIVQLAAPFAPFPEKIRKETDLLHITRTWRFERGSRLASGP